MCNKSDNIDRQGTNNLETDTSLAKMNASCVLVSFLKQDVFAVVPWCPGDGNCIQQIV
jgi:hypothetical protein